METPIIQLSDICARYDDKQVLSGVSLCVYPHDYLAIIGPNGGGKTTLMRIILGLKKPESGQLDFYRDGQRVEQLSIG